MRQWLIHSYTIHCIIIFQVKQTLKSENPSIETTRYLKKGGNHVIEKKVTQKNICHRKILVTKWQKFLPKFSITFRSLYDMVKNFYHMVKKILSHGKNKFLWVMDWSRYSSPPPCEFKITQESYMIYSNVNVYTSIWRKCFRAHFTGRFFQNKINYHFDFKNSWN